MATERRVVALVCPRMLTNAQTGMYAARILELGLTAYGKTQDEAQRKVVRMYASSVQAHRELGTLEEWLNRSGLNWFWEEEYKGAQPAIAADAEISQKIREQEGTHNRPNRPSVWLSLCDDLPMAA